jgi:hypothetical protein
MILDPRQAEILNRVSIEKGFNMADSTLRNGFIGDFLGFDVYISNNLTSDHALAGKKGAIDFVMQKSPTVEKRMEPKRHQTNFLTTVLYGYKTFTKKSKGLVDVNVDFI